VRSRGAFAATLVYALVALATTWPLALGLATDLPSDLGDPALNVFILGRNLQRLGAALGGDPGALHGFWDARIFHPEPLTLAYSEHLLAQSLLVLPLHLLGGNPILAYNTAFLASFVLSALGAFLLARDLLGRADAAFLTGLLFGFAPYRVDQLSHVQVLSSQWMPFVLLGLVRYARTGHAAPLFWACVALVAQSLSCGYYALFFPPFAAAVGLAWLARAGMLRRPRTFIELGLGAAGVAALTIPALLPYAEVRGLGVLLREPWEVERFSADVYSYLTAPEFLTLWGPRLRSYDLSEGALFPGVVPLALACLAVVTGALDALRSARSPQATGGRLSRALPPALAATSLVLALLFAAVVLGLSPLLAAWAPWLGLRRPARLLLLLGAVAAACSSCRRAQGTWPGPPSAPT
jgi:hypothetical protein